MFCENDVNKVPIKQLQYNQRIDTINKLFEDEFHSKPSFYVRVPGRVNIIGEHIDYCGYPVLPMALEQDIIVGVCLIDNLEIQLRNTDSKYESFRKVLKSFADIEIVLDSKGKPFWYSYVLCGIKGALEFLNNKIEKGILLYVDGNIPPASGLSSSSALVSASLLSFLYAQNVVISKTEIASLCAKSERYIGTEGGGMDQAIAFLAEKNCAQYITWQPLQATPIALPEDAAFVVAHSVAEANKAATNDFNRRVIECRLSAKILSISTGSVNDNKIISLSEVQKVTGATLEDMIKLVNQHLHKEIYNKKEVCNILNISEDKLNEVYLTPNTIHLTEFKLKQRALHVYQEAKRVEEFRNICIKSSSDKISNGVNGNLNGDYNSKLEALGKLMLASHESLRYLYECSHENLDYLVDISKEMNVFSRLTGAGWGGCVVTLCHKNDVENYVAFIKERFYEKQCNIPKNDIAKYIFSTKPNHGAAIYIEKIAAP